MPVFSSESKYSDYVHYECLDVSELMIFYRSVINNYCLVNCTEDVYGKKKKGMCGYAAELKVKPENMQILRAPWQLPLIHPLF